MTTQRSLRIKPRILSASVLFLAVLTVLTALAAPATAQNPVPLTNQPLVPDATAPGGAGFTLTVNGTGFLATSTVNWNGTPRATTFVSRSQLTAAILASDIATASTAAVTVVNPSPGGGVSNIQFFSIAVAEGSVSFLPAVAYSSGGSGSTSLAVADLRGNGKLDVVVANCIASGGVTCGAEGVVGVLLGKGDGTFQPVVTYDSGGVGATSIAIADVNGDGKPDLIVANACPVGGCPPFASDGVVTVLLGKGDGTFQPAVAYDSGGVYPGSVAVADVNGDGKLDIVVANSENVHGTGIVGVLLGNGDGTFQPAIAYGGPGLQGATWVAVADLNGDGKPDLAVAYECEPNCYSSAAVGVMLGNGDGTFQPAVIYPSGGAFSFSVAVGDVNGDGKPDLVVANTNSSPCSSNGCAPGDGVVGVLLGNGDGTFRAAVSYDSGGAFAYSIAVADVNGDGRPDLLGANDNSGTTGLLLGNGDGTFQTAAAYTSGYAGPDSVVAADLNGDGRPDVVAGGPGMVDVLLNNGGSAERTTTTTLASSPSSSVYRQKVTFTAHVTASSGTPTGTVLLFDGATVVASGAVTNGSASIVDSSLPVGANSITAEYTGGGGFASSSSARLTQTVIPAKTTTALASSVNPAATNQPVTFTASVTSRYGGAATGSVVFLAGSQTMGTASVSGNRATLTTSFADVGTYSISAKYSGDGNNAGSTSSTVREVITAATTTTLASSLNPSIYGQSVTWTATVTTSGTFPPTRNVNFIWNGYSIGEAAVNASGVATLTRSNLNADTYPLTAAYLGDANNGPSTSAILKQVVTETTSAATLTSSPNPSTQGQAVTFTATITSPTVRPIGPVTFTAGKTVLGTAQLSSGKAKFTTSTLAVGSTTVKATYSGDSNIAKSSASVAQRVQQ